MLAVKSRWAQLLSPLPISIGVALASLVLFERLADEVFEGETKQFDSTVRDFVHSFESSRLTLVMRGLTDIGNITGVMAGTTIGCLVLWLKKRRHGTVLLAINTFGGVILMWSLKLLFRRQRPEPYFGITKPSDYSFPSGHSLVAVCFYVALAVIITTEQKHVAPRIAIWIVSGEMVVGIGISRIYLGVHYPSDVLAGYLAALFWVTGVSIAYRRFQGREAQTMLQPGAPS